MPVRITTVAIVALLAVSGAVYCCEVIRTGPPLTTAQRNARLVELADAIVLAKAVEYALPLTGSLYRNDGEPTSRIRLEVIQVLKGHVDASVEIGGYLSDTDDYNDQTPADREIRSFAKRVNCFADDYRRGGLFLLLLKPGKEGLSTRWAYLSPTNEQVRSIDDPWVAWVKDEIAAVR
jgi:hypothetical protein